MIDSSLSCPSFETELCFLVSSSPTEVNGQTNHVNKTETISVADGAVTEQTIRGRSNMSSLCRVCIYTLCLAFGPLMLHPPTIVPIHLGDYINNFLDRILVILGTMAILSIFTDELIKSIIRMFEGLVGILAFFVPFVEIIAQIIRAIGQFVPWCCNPPYMQSGTNEMSLWERILLITKDDDNFGFFFMVLVTFLISSFIFLGIFIALQNGKLVTSTVKEKLVADASNRTYIELSLLSILLTLIYDNFTWVIELSNEVEYILRKGDIQTLIVSFILLSFPCLIFFRIGTFLTNTFMKIHGKKATRYSCNIDDEQKLDVAGSFLHVVTCILSVVVFICESVVVTFITGGNVLTESVFVNNWTLVESRPSKLQKINRRPLERVLAVISVMYGILICFFLLMITAFLTGIYLQDFITNEFQVVLQGTSPGSLVLLAICTTLLSSVCCIPPTYMSLCLGYVFSLVFDQRSGFFLSLCAVLIGLGAGTLVCRASGQMIGDIAPRVSVNDYSLSYQRNYIFGGDDVMRYVFLSAVRISDIVPYHQLNYFVGMNMISCGVLDFFISIISILPKMLVSLQFGSFIGCWSMSETNLELGAFLHPIILSTVIWYSVVNLSAFVARKIVKKAVEKKQNQNDCDIAVGDISNYEYSLEAPLLL